jgi:hypothetical protein
VQCIGSVFGLLVFLSVSLIVYLQCSGKEYVLRRRLRGFILYVFATVMSVKIWNTAGIRVHQYHCGTDKHDIIVSVKK